MEKKFLYKDETFKIIGAAMVVHSTLGGGLKEKVYQDALKVELELRGIPAIKEYHIPISYKGVKLEHDYFADFLCFNKIIVELKSVSELTIDHESQLLTYMRLNKCKVGLLLNFGTSSLTHIRRAL